MLQHNTAFFYIDIQNVLEFLGVTRGSISITLGRQILVTKSCSLFTMHLMQIYVIFFFTQSWYLWLLVFEKKQMRGFKNILRMN